MPARTRKIRHDENTRAKIQAALIINRLQGHVMGDVQLDAAQVSSAKTLLNKVLPDLTYNENENTHELGDSFQRILEYIGQHGSMKPRGDDGS